MDALSYDFDWSILAGEAGLRLLQGALVTLQLAALSWIGALAFGVALASLRWYGGRAARFACQAYVDFMRNTPPLVHILFWYFSAGFLLPDFLILRVRDLGLEFGAAVLALVLYHTAFVSEIVRAGLQSVEKGQFEAAAGLGLKPRQALRTVILPQVIRITLPPLTSEAISLTKNTSLALAVGVAEITYQARYIDTYTFRGVEALMAATVLYLVICLTIANVGAFLDRRLAYEK